MELGLGLGLGLGLWGWGCGGYMVSEILRLGARLLHRGVRPQLPDEHAALRGEGLGLGEVCGELRLQRSQICRLLDVALVDAVEQHLHRGHRVGLHDGGVRRPLLGSVARLVDDLHLHLVRVGVELGLGLGLGMGLGCR